MNSWLVDLGVAGKTTTNNTKTEKTKRVTKEREARKANEIIKLREKGMSVDEIAQAAQTSLSYVYSVLTSRGLYEKKTGKWPTMPVLQYDLQGNFMREYDSAFDAARVTGIHADFIRAVCNPNATLRKTAKGFIFKYKKEGRAHG